MTSEEILQNIKEVVNETIPIGAVVTNVEFEGPDVVIYTRNPGMLIDDSELIKEMARKLRKRIVIRPDPSVLTDEETATEGIRSVVPEEAQITSISFDHTSYEVVIEARKPGLVIGKSGNTLREIAKKIRWAPRVVRTPPIESSTVRGIRETLEREIAERREILMRIGHRIYRSEDVRSQWVRITALGGFREVGRSCLLLQTPESKILLDCGVNVASDDPNIAYPYLSAPEFKYVLTSGDLDAVVISHAHLDHSGFVPFLYKYGYDGPVYCTPPTRDLSTLLQLDYMDISQRENKDVPYSRKEIREVVKHTITLDYKEVRDIAPDVRLTLHNAGHILGSSIIHLHVGNGLHNIAYTGDLKYDYTKLFEPASTRFPRLETLIIESTYGGYNDRMPPRTESERQLMHIIKDTIARKGKVLIPVLSVGRAQEIVVVLEEYVRTGQLEGIPVWLDGMIWEATAIHTTYPEYLCRKLRDQIFHQGHNPFLSDAFDAVGDSNQRKSIMEGDPAIILATSGMLIGGPSVEYFKNLADDPANTLVFVSYQAEGSLGSRVQKGWNEIPLKGENGKTEVIRVNMDVCTVDGFSGHSDHTQLINFVRKINSKLERVLTNHGDGSKSIELASIIYKTFKKETRSPLNLETMRLS
ncbi:MAG: beta-CASP ribonuclease aCPSF1 [Theionarchaea archaeon]|nr:beta-CASP ribonuclease aCPSF1 [Theionarchaea archaeon]MBU7001474.1 beta-CASP ribonuclease aCPSF1 [Theionarchaea archaeon]MBU7022218.1 beta-CASP ribonuclease aCPSF1 [Theionarchaea archaeon]MBU7035099.1 beta-CASP ribonuclease aCPSF1 [Theionarchaea archaeon]MBU7040234.1 beta-CASP ribonuclease aCPSF1 [Theionarchaea archaeon]